MRRLQYRLAIAASEKAGMKQWWNAYKNLARLLEKNGRAKEVRRDVTRVRASCSVVVWTYAVLSLLSSHMLYLPFSSVTCRFLFALCFFFA